MQLNKNRFHSRLILAGGAGLGLTLTLGVAYADASLEEVIVTAQKRSENVQDVPISISAFTASALQERSIGDISQLSNIAPNVTLDAGTPFSGSGSVLAAYIRGIGQNDFAFNLDPGVGVYLDGVYLARTVGANQDLLDVERVEVLKGPQGTLFGRNTIGGAISVVTRDPSDDFAYQADLTTGSFDRIQVRGSIDVPLAESLKSSITVGVKRRQGYQERVPFDFGGQAYALNDIRDYQHINYDSASHEGGDDVWNARVKFKWDNGGAVQARLSADYTNIDQPATANSLLLAVPSIPGPFAGLAANNVPGTAFDPSATSGFLFAGLYNFCINATGAQIAARNAQNLCGPRGTALNPSLQLAPLASANVDADPFNNRLPFDNRFVTNDPDKSYATGASNQRLHNWGAAGVLDFELTDNLALKSITALRDMDWKVGMDIDGSPLTTLAVSFEMNQQQFSQELQFNGNALDERLKFVLGLYYFREQGDLHDYVTFSDGLLQVDGPNDLWTRNYGAFTQIDWRLTDLIGITVGGRYTKENKEFEGFQADLNGSNYKLFNCMDFAACRAPLNFPDPNYALRYYVPGTQKKDFNNFSPKVGVQVYPADDVMLYASYAEGYKTGGWTTRLSNPLPPDPVTGVVPAPDFDEETAETYEVGLKSQFFDNRVQVNGAIFRTDYSGIQLNFQQGVSPTIQNAGDARIKGAELELNTVLTDSLSVAASFGYTDAEYTAVLPQSVVAPNPFQAGVFVAGELPKTPKTKFNLSPRYEIAVSGGAAIVLLADYTRTGELWNDTERTFLLRRDATDTFNASVAYKAEGGKWDLTLGGTNLSDERFLVTGQAQLGGGLIYGTYNRPREWYLMLHVRE